MNSFSTKKISLATYLLSRGALLITICLFASGNLLAQTTWTGSSSSDWNVAGNWSAGVPDGMDTVNIPDVATDPVISVAGALAKSVTIQSGAVLTINSPGTLTLNNNTVHSMLNLGTVTNTGTINIGTTATPAGASGIRNNGTFNNNTGGQITVNRSSSKAIWNYSGTFNNQGTLSLGTTNTIGIDGIRNRGTFNNSTGSVITVDRSAAYGVYCEASSTFTNQGSVTIGSIVPVSTLLDGVSATFTNSTGGTVQGTGFITSAIFVNAGGAITPGYSPGKITFFGKENFNNSIKNIEVNGKNLAGGDFDQIVVSDTTTYGGTLALNINFPGAAIGDEIPIWATNGYKDTFDVITGLLPNWFIQYKPTGIILRYGAVTETAWIGDSSTVWDSLENWSAGIPTALTDVFIDDTSTYYPIVTSAKTIKSLRVRTGGSITINSTGTLNIEGSNELAIENDGTITNHGIINIGATVSPGFIGIDNGATFNNKPGAQIKIDRTTYFGLYNSGGTFTNEASLTIGGLVSPGIIGIWNAATFSNSTGSSIVIDRSTDGALFNDTLSVFTNATTISIGSGFNSGGYGIRNKSVFNNNAGASITINRTANYGIFHTFNTFTNLGTISIGSTHGVGDYGLYLAATFNNSTGSTLTINRAVLAGIFNAAGSSTNQATLTIGNLATIPGLITGSAGTFSNSTGGILNGSGTIAANVFASSGGTLSPGYSPGIMTFIGTENLSNNTINIEVNGSTTPGVDYDMIVGDNLTLGGTLALTFPYTGVPGDDITIISASSITGTFATVTGLPVGWTLNYTATAVKVTYIPAGSTTWTGSASIAWSNASNWSSGVPLPGSEVIIPDVATNDPTISTAISVKTITIDAGGVLTISAAGTLTINNSAAQGMLNNGTVNNNGIIHVGSTTSVGTHGLRNASVFNNNSGAQLNINRSGNTALENTSTFTNTGTINIGNIANVGPNGILNTSVFNNNSGGQINVDRSGDAGIHNNTGGTWTNVATINVGATMGVGEFGIRNNATFNNNAGGQINVNRSTEAAIENTGPFTNLANINIGGIAGVGDYGIRSSGTFNSNGGQITIDRTLDAALSNELGGTFVNQITINIGSSQSVGQYGLWNSGTFSNNAGGQININRSTVYGLWNFSATFTNVATINIGATTMIGQFGIYNNGTFHNNAGGQIGIGQSVDAGIYNYGLGTFNNLAILNIGATQGVGQYGIRNLFNFNNNGGHLKIDRSTDSGIYNDNGVFTNIATISIGSIANVGSYGIRNRDEFYNNTGGLINIDRASISGIYIESSDVSNQGTIIIGALVPMANLITGTSGSFDNNSGGILKGTGSIQSNFVTNGGGTYAPGYSPGIMTFNGDMIFTNSTISVEVNGKTTAGTDFDRIVVVGTATLGGNLHVINNFPGAMVGDQITILTATSRVGTFATVTGLPGNWGVVYTATSVILTLGPFLPVQLISFKAGLLDDNVRLDWKTASEVNNKGFYIERSTDGFNWTKIGFVNGKGTSTKVESYSYLDETVLSSYLVSGSNVFYYRLRQVDQNGKEEFSKVESVDLRPINTLPNTVKVFPNPSSSDNINIEVSANIKEQSSAQLLTLTGDMIQSIPLLAGSNKMNAGGLKGGVYILKILNSSQSHLVKIILVD